MMKRWPLLMVAVVYCSALAVFAHVGFLGPRLAAYAQEPPVPMGKTTLIKPGMTVTASDGSRYKIMGGVSTANPKGYVLDWAGPHGFYECETPHKTANGSCRDGIRLHYVNPATGKRQDALVRSPNEPIPVSVPAREGN